MRKVTAVLSGKGGTGKTSVCAGLAIALAQTGEKVLCIDCAVGLRNLDIALGMSDVSTLSFLEVCRGEYPVTMAAKHPVYPTLQFLTAPMHCAPEDIDISAFSAMLEAAKEQFDYVFLDGPAGVGAGFDLTARFADRILTVTCMDPGAMRDAYRVGELLEQIGKRNVRIIVNRVSEKTLKTTKLTIDDVMDKTGLPLLGIVPEDVNMALAAHAGAPLLKLTTKGAAAACERISRRMKGYFVPITL